MITLFEKICAREIPADIVYEDDICVCFRDIAPQAPVHLVLVPRKPIPRIAAAELEDANILGQMMCRIGEITRAAGLAENGFRVVINNGSDGGETVAHLHIHLLGGRQMTWPPG
ncbi:MAG TPA: histidine triad nucleotide-binding protein [Verrucomicrobiales bacterium]|nr:MAG: histidine triad nucleotide-binding protein [Verrucomicrobiae bacterium Tous-C3TDCM]PAZ05422.1 MAG: histidine triad nucleotide-binding protein [Verrucomicrobiae bacterium AMD-G2]HBE22429.1 histidine triad nucleotide-binding protein [Verrucomicrobiales bacterium]